MQLITNKQILIALVLVIIFGSVIYHFYQSNQKNNNIETTQNGSKPIDNSKLTMKQLSELIKNDSSIKIIDVRTPQEYSSGHIPNSLNIDVQSPNFKVEIEKLDKTQKYVVYCRSGNRSLSAYNQMLDVGFTQMFNADQGFGAWEQLGLSIEK